jgi:hypothetical protein
MSAYRLGRTSYPSVASQGYAAYPNPFDAEESRSVCPEVLKKWKRKLHSIRSNQGVRIPTPEERDPVLMTRECEA